MSVGGKVVFMDLYKNKEEKGMCLFRNVGVLLRQFFISEI